LGRSRHRLLTCYNKTMAALTAADNNMGDDDGWVNGG
jgi:hypothetical protein